MNWDATTRYRAPLACRKFLVVYSELNKRWSVDVGNGACWHVVPKFHLLIHCVDSMLQSGSVVRSWCYADERSIGKGVKVASRGHPRSVCKVRMESIDLGSC